MVRKAWSVFLAFVMVFAMIVPQFVSEVEAAPNRWDASRYGDVLDIGTKLRYFENNEEYKAELDDKIKRMAEDINFDEVYSEAQNENGNFTYNGGTKYFLGYDIYGYYFKTYTQRSVGDYVEIWVADELEFMDDRPTPVITQEQVDRLREEFDNNIYIKDTEFFGTPDSHTGENSLLSKWGYVPENYYVPEDGIERVIILVDNIRDENFYDPTYPFFVAGFYSSSYETYFDRNIISLDTNSWETRLENTFFGTTAHELQHLIHDDNDSMEESWINEGMSDFAEYLCGYGHPWGHVNFFLDHPENSLVEWDDHYSAETGPETLADYGQAYLLQLYLNDHYGRDFIQTLAKDKEHGIAGVNKVLSDFGEDIDFQELFRRFTIALVVDNYEPGDGIYNFESIDVKINFELAQLYDKDGVPAWGGDYKVIKHANKIQTIKFDGVDFMPNPWKNVEDPMGGNNQVLWGNEGNEIDNFLIFEADLTDVENATLKFDNYIDIEKDPTSGEGWDFGFVQVSTDGGDTWVTLSNENTSYVMHPDGYPAIRDNLPGFTGTYDDWQTEEFDLTPYAGSKIHIAFRYMTDWASNGAGWFIKNIEIPEIGYFNDGTNVDDFISIDQLKEMYVDYAVAFINEKSSGKGKNKTSCKVLNIDPFNVTEADALQLKEFFSGGNNYMVIWYAAPEGKKGVVDYTYEITEKSEYNKNKK